jgi:uncharacterized membrane protein
MIASDKKASTAHEWVMMNLAFFHLVIPVMALNSAYLYQLLAFSLLGALLMIGQCYRNANKFQHIDVVGKHWQLAWQRSRFLLFSYVAAIIILVIGGLLGSLQTDEKMASIMMVVFSRIAVMPVLLTVMVLFVLETTALSEARAAQLNE